MVTYGHQVISDDDAYLKLIEKVNVATLDSGAPGSAMVDLIPARWSFKKKYNLYLCTDLLNDRDIIKYAISLFGFLEQNFNVLLSMQRC